MGDIYAMIGIIPYICHNDAVSVNFDSILIAKAAFGSFSPGHGDLRRNQNRSCYSLHQEPCCEGTASCSKFNMRKDDRYVF